MDREDGPGDTPPTATAAPTRTVHAEGPLATNSWARRTIISRSEAIGLAPEAGKQVGRAAVWYYNRLVILLNPRNATDRELPQSTNRYLVPIALKLACDYRGQAVDFDRLIRLSGNPTEKTIQTAHVLLRRYSRMVAPARRSPVLARPGRVPPSAPSRKETGTSPGPLSPPSTAADAAARGAYILGRPSPAPPSSSPVTALATTTYDEALQVRKLFPASKSSDKPAKPAAARAKSFTSNAWARRRIGEMTKALGLPDRLRRRALMFYDRIVDFHSRKNPDEPVKRLELSPRLNWSLVFTTIYLACRYEEYPKDLRVILGPTQRQGTMREVYRLFRFYRRRLGLPIKSIDVRTFIHSWFDGYELSEILYERANVHDAALLRKRAVAIAEDARKQPSMKGMSSKMIAAGAFTTAIAETAPPSRLSAFYKAIAAFLHMNEGALRAVVYQIVRRG